MKKLLLIVCALLATVGAWATDVTVLPANGVYWKNGAASSDAWAPTWKSTATASDLSTPLLTFEGQTGMNTANGNIYSNQTYTLTAPSGYVIVGYTFNGTATGADITITPAGGSGTTVVSGSSLDTPLSVDVNAQTTTFALASSGDAHFESLALTVKVEHYVITYGTGTGSYNSTTANYVNTWTSTATDPQVTFSVSGGANNIQRSNGYIYSGTAKSSIYTIAAQAGYLVTGYEIKGTAQTNAQTLTPAGGTAVSFGTDKEYTLSVTGLSAASVTFTQAGENKGIAISSFKIFLEKDPCTVTYVISDASGVIFTSDALSANTGETITALPSNLQRAFCSYSEINHTVTAGENTINVTVEYNMPFEEGKWYYMTLRGHNVYYSSAANDVRTNQSGKEETQAYQWGFSGTPYTGIKVQNRQTGTYLTNTASTVQLTESGFAWTLAQLNNTTTFGLANGANYINEQNHTNHNLIYWTNFTTDTGSQFNVEEVEDDGIVYVTYNVVIDGTTVLSAEQAHNAGDAPAIPSELERDYTTYSFDVETISATTTTVTVTPTFSGLPFEVSTDYNSAKWYYMNGHASHSDRFISTNEDAIVWGVGNSETDAYKWAFIGNPVEGFKLINKATGADKYLLGTNPATMGTGEKTWILKKQTNTTYQCGDKGFGLWDAKLTYLNTQASTLKYWGSFDQGSTFWVTQAPSDTEVYNALIAELESYTFGTAIGQYSLNAANQDYTNQAATIIAGLKSQGYTAENLTIAQALVEGISLNTPSAGYYRLKNVATNKYLTATALASGYTDTNKYVFANGDGNSAATVIRLFDKDSNGKLYMYNQGAGFGWVATTTGGKVGWITTNPDKYVNWFAGNAAGQIAFALCLGNGTGSYAAYLTQGIYTADANEAVIAGTDYTADAAQWVVEEATSVSIALNNGGDGNYYATLCLPFTVTLDGCNAYTLTLNSAKTGLTLSEPMTEVPAGTPVFLKGTSASATASIAADAAYGSPLTTTALTGTYLDLTVNGDTDYFLGKLDGKVGFYHWNGTKLKANRAYMEASKLNTTSNVKGFVIDFDSADAIRSLFENAEDSDIYDLSGRRISQPKHGIFIVNGKKIIVK